MRHRQIEKAFSNLRSLFVVLAQAPKTIQPAESAFNNPSFGLRTESRCFLAGSNLRFDAENLLTPMHKRITGISFVKKEQFQPIKQGQTLQKPLGRDFVLFISWMNQRSQQPALCIDRYLALATLLALKWVKSTGPLFSAVCTDWLSTITTLGSASRSSWRRISLRRLSLIFCMVLRSTSRRQKAYTVLQGGNSWGNIRHWQPVRAKYSSALIFSRGLWMGFRPRFFFGSSGSIRSHCSSLKSVG